MLSQYEYARDHVTDLQSSYNQEEGGRGANDQPSLSETLLHVTIRLGMFVACLYLLQ